MTFAAGSATATVTVTPAADGTVEANETVVLTVTAGAGYAVGSPGAATGTITDDDTEVGVSVSRMPVADPGLEQVSVDAGQYRYRPTGTPWALADDAGLAANGGGVTSGNPPAPQGTQAAFLQGIGSRN